MSGLLTVGACAVHDGPEADQRRADGLTGSALKAGVEVGIESFVSGYLLGEPALDQGNAPAWRVGLVPPMPVGWAVFDAEAALDALIGEIE